jgi:ribosomal protein S18 acetylase RimI-like enzyme
MKTMLIVEATLADVPELNILINSSYRGNESKKGWTNEADLLEGTRIDEEMLTEYINNKSVSILKYTNDSEQIIGSVYLEVREPKLYLGMLSVLPMLQGKGIGRALLEQAETIAKQLHCHTICISVIDVRTELINWYERRGYVFTGEAQPFPSDGRFGDPKQSMALITMEKAI